MAMDNVSVLKYNIQTVNEIMEEFSDIKQDLETIANEREKIRVNTKNIDDEHIFNEKMGTIGNMFKALIDHEQEKK